MERAAVEIVRCRPEYSAESVALVLGDLAPSQRGEVAGRLACAGSAVLDREPLFIALRGEQLRGAAWGQLQPGKTAVFWPPQLVAGESHRTARLLAESVVAALDVAGVEMTQVLLPSAEADAAPLLAAAGFRHLADLLYMSCEAIGFPADQPVAAGLEFEPYDESEQGRLLRLLERTYRGTLDCAALNGKRSTVDVIAGYRDTGVFRPQNWRIVRCGTQDVGIMLLADHPAARHWELMYMGLVPEARRRGWGAQIAQYAKWLAGRAGVERIVLAVDAANEPALRMYRSQGFEAWDCRTILARFSPGRHEA